MMKSIFSTYKYLDQVVFWGFIFCFIFDYHFLNGNWSEAIASTLLELSSYVALLYSNYLLLIPVFLSKKRYLGYGLGVLLLLLLYIYSIRWSGLEYYLYEGSEWRNNFSMTINVILFVLLSSFYWSYQQWQQQREQQFQLRSEKLEAELKFLKMQISPHFIFNSLNNIYSLAIQKHDNTAPMVAKLSNIMRYVLYDGAAETIILEKEIINLEHYVQLQLLRKPISNNIDFYTEGNFKKHQIIPLLLLNFVENCFKHSDIDTNETAFIAIAIRMENDTLFFETQNSFSSKNKEQHEPSGIGLENTKRQLQLQYPQKYDLTIHSEKAVYTVKLQLSLQKRV